MRVTLHMSSKRSVRVNPHLQFSFELCTYEMCDILLVGKHNVGGCSKRDVRQLVCSSHVSRALVNCECARGNIKLRLSAYKLSLVLASPFSLLANEM